MTVMVPGTPATIPSNFAPLRDGRLLNNSNLTRMPTTQREWNTFIQELNKWIKSETGVFDVGLSADAQFTGFSTDPANAAVWYMRYGQFVHMEFYFQTGTSDSISFAITGIPETLRPRDDVTVACAGLWNNGASLAAGEGTCVVQSTGVLSFNATPHGGAWTASSTKGFATSGRFGIIYPLRQPGKL
jgi:hypothetical protein